MTNSTTIALAQLSDPHVIVGGDDHGAAQALEAAVAAVLDLRPLPLAVLVSGDLTEHGDPREYERVAELLAPLPMPVHVLAGNHDDRGALLGRFPIGGVAGDGVVQYTAPCGALRLVACDSTIPGREGGALDGGRLEWLEAALAAEPRVPTLVALHHPPLVTGLPAFDEEWRLADADRVALGDLVRRHPQVRRIAAGHTHRTIVGTAGGCGVLACPSTHLLLDLDVGGRDRPPRLREGPGLAIHVLAGNELSSHVLPVGGGYET